MGSISISNIIDGTLAKAADVNSRLAIILGVINGNIDAANIKSGSITQPLMANNSIGTSQIQDGSITRSKVASASTSITTNATITPDAQIYIVTALATDTTIAPVAGTPYSGQPLVLRIKDNGTARAISWNSIYRGVGVTLPTTTSGLNVLYAAGRYNLEDARWDILGVGRG